MKKSKKFLAMLLLMIFGANIMFVQPVYASTNTDNIHDVYAKGITEVANIEGINYTYYCYYENGNRTVTISNDINNEIDKVVYNESASAIYLNGQILASLDTVSQEQAPSTRIGWETLSTSSHYVSWKQGAGVAAVAAALSAYLTTLGPAGIISGMGVAALGAIGASTSGGTLYVELDWFYAPFVAPQYRYVYSFRASTGDYYGPYYYTYFA